MAVQEQLQLKSSCRCRGLQMGQDNNVRTEVERARHWLAAVGWCQQSAHVCSALAGPPDCLQHIVRHWQSSPPRHTPAPPSPPCCRALSRFRLDSVLRTVLQCGRGQAQQT